MRNLFVGALVGSLITSAALWAQDSPSRYLGGGFPPYLTNDPWGRTVVLDRAGRVVCVVPP
jgi:hypothetical protein